MLRRLTPAAEQPLRVMMTVDAVGGVWTYALDLAAELGFAGHATTLVLAGPPPSETQRRHAEGIAGVSLIDIDAPLDWTARNESELADAALATARVATQIRPDVVHLNSPALAGYARFERPVLGVCHSCLATWWSAVKLGSAPPELAWRIAAAARGIAACDALVAPSRAFAEATRACYGTLPGVVHNGRTSLAAPRRRPRPLVLTAGRLWDEGKDLHTLDGAAETIAAPVVALGSTDAPDGSRIGLNRLRTVGAVDGAGVAQWLARAQVFVSTARYEPFGLAVLEAAQAGLPLVLSDIPTFRELWTGAADFVTPGQPAGFAAACNRLLRDPEARRQAGRAARSRAKRYDNASMGRSYLALYRRLVGAGASALSGARA